MDYRRMGHSGLKVSVLSYGTWITFVEQAEDPIILANLAVAREAGINLFDTADGYGQGAAEERLGKALQLLRWPRSSYVLSTKLYFGTEPWVNMQCTLNRKYLLHAIDESLHRLRTPFVDLLFCHRPDPHTPLEEIVWTMSDIVGSGKAHYWGTSEWPPEMIRNAWALADRLSLRKPSMEQVEYNLIRWSKVDTIYADICQDLGLGMTTWSPLASGLLTGKYFAQMPPGSRATIPEYSWLGKMLAGEEASRAVEPLKVLAKAIGATPAQLAIAWCATHPQISSVILGASRPEQLRENVKAIDLLPLFTQEFRGRILRAMRSIDNGDEFLEEKR